MRTPFKRLFSLCLCLALVLALFPESRAKAVEYEYDSSTGLYYYHLGSERVAIAGCDPAIKGVLMIPDTIAGKSVTDISSKAFSGSRVLQVIVPASVRNVGEYAFDRGDGGADVQSVVFLGDPPSFHPNALGDGRPYWMSLHYYYGPVHYPLHNSKWNTVITQQYGAPGGVIWEGIHSPGEEMLTTLPTCTTEGSHSFSCTVCGEDGIITIPAHGHSWDEGTTVTVATCVDEGTTVYVCNTCGEIEIKIKPAKGHVWQKAGIVSQPTCTQEGVQRYACAYCSATREAAIKVKDHKWGETVVVGTPNCLESVTVDYICTDCGTIGNRQTLNAPGHSYESTIKPATCTDPGQIVYTCKTCGDTRSTETSPATGHQYETGTCIHCGITLTGDVNGDNTVDIADVARLYAHIRNTTPLEEPHLQNADTTGDGTVDIADVAKLYAHTKGTASLP